MIFTNISTKSVEEFYNNVNIPLPENFKKKIGHFNVFAIDEFIRGLLERNMMPYNRRSYYKIDTITLWLALLKTQSIASLQLRIITHLRNFNSLNKFVF